MEDSRNGLQLSAGFKGSCLESRNILLTDIHDSGIVVYAVRNMAVEAGFGSTDEFMIATAASELTTNILRYAGSGALAVSVVRNRDSGLIGIELFASDTGPGIADLEKAMREQFTTSKNSLGLGLPSVRNIMDEFYIETLPGKGTRVLAYKWKENEI